ncbi:MAG: peptidoglycan bridge formation glycyltransferase FemA/FemB family protein [Patescibacteria group bacterium]
MTHPLQTRQWAKFRREWGNEVGFVKKNLIVFSKIPYTGFTIGTVLKGSAITRLDLVLSRKVGQKHNAIFIKFEPNLLHEPKLENKYKKLGLVKGKRLFTPTSFWIDLTLNEEELLKSFSSKTRYNIRLAQKRGVIVKEDSGDEVFEKYLELTTETNKRQGFYSHSEKYHRLMWQHLKDKIAHLLTATYNGEIISTWILFAHDGFLYYPYGASTDKYKEVMANNLMMWEAIKFGKKIGLNTFDLWGREEGKGFTKFKEGYNPKVVEFIGTWDLIINKPLYYIYRIAEKIRWFILRLGK